MPVDVAITPLLVYVYELVKYVEPVTKAAFVRVSPLASYVYTFFPMVAPA
jgi:hypothetical protein